MENHAIITFTKNSNIGTVKTRIASTLGDEKALLIYKELLKITEDLLNLINSNCYIYWDSYIPQNKEFFSNRKYVHKVQEGKDLGERMCNAFKDVLGIHKNVLIIGTDCPYLEYSHILDAFQSLNTYDYCIGPASDGGYYLLGLTSFMQDWFQNIPWSTSSVFSDTQKIAKKNNLSGYILPILSDIDNELDYINWKGISLDSEE